MGEITKLREEPEDGVVPLLQDMLAKAMNGEITDVAIVCIHSDNDIGYYTPSTKNFHKLLGALDCLKYDMIKEKHVDG